MSSLIKRFFGGIKVYFGAEFRSYTITFFFFLIVTAILAPLFILLDIEKLNNIELVYVIGVSPALIYLVYMFLTMSERIRKVFFQTKWKYLLAVFLPIGGTIGLSFLFFHLIERIPDILYYTVTFFLLGTFFIWLIIQLFTFGLFVKDVNTYLIDKIETKPEGQKTKFILFSIFFQVGLVIYLFALRSSFADITEAINHNLIKLPFNMWLFPLIITIFSGVLLTITLISKKYRAGFFSTGYILLYSLYLLYHIAYLLVYIYDETGTFVKTINLVSLAFFTFSVVYALQASAALIKTKLENWWQPISFFLFAIALCYVTWSITFLYTLAEQGQVPDLLLEVIFWSINHLLSYVLGILLIIITIFIFLGRLKRKKEVE
jgi:hypothetical protein